ncbi:polysaccharide pyruvyl transferase family protein [Brucella melitensis]|uniref:polysaccharide pyruvyl transferase family protein n=1 Tax=Brucella melitensis TaxID=29459 RepID=UPI0031FDDF12
MKIGLFGQFGSGNTGNDGSLEAMLQMLARACPDADIVCICSRPEIIAEKFHIAATPVGREPFVNGLLRRIDKALLQLPRRLSGFIAAVSIAQGLDLIIVPGTGILDDFSENPFGWPFVIMRWSLAARLGGAKFAFVSIGAGPVVQPLSRFFVHVASRLAAFRSYRDNVSYEFMQTLGINTRIDTVTADIAFALPVPDAGSKATAGRRCIGLGVMTHRGWKKDSAQAPVIYETYLDKMADMAEGLLASGYRIRLLTGDISDLMAVDDLMARLAAPARANIVFEPVTSLNGLMQQIAHTDIVVASRYHNIVCALATGRPAISLGYAAKNDALLHDAGLDRFCHHIEDFDPQTVLMQVRQMFANLEQLREGVEAGVARYRLHLARQEEVQRTSLLAGMPMEELTSVPGRYRKTFRR